MISFLVFFCPSVSLCCARHSKRKDDVRILLPELYSLECGNCIKAEGASAEKPSVTRNICIGDAAVNHFRNQPGPVRGKIPVTGKEGGTADIRRRRRNVIHISPFSARQGKLRSEPGQYRTAAYVFFLLFVFQEVSFFV